MSTRCQIEFKEISNYLGRKKPIIERRTIYRHSDGYPDGECGIISDIKKFLQWDRGFDIEYTPSNFLYWDKVKTIQSLQNNPSCKSKEEKQEIEDRWSKIGYGVCENDEFHGDLAYFYELVNEITETEKNCFKIELNLFVYGINKEKTKQGFLKPTKRENLKLIKTVKISTKTKRY